MGKSSVNGTCSVAMSVGVSESIETWICGGLHQNPAKTCKYHIHSGITNKHRFEKLGKCMHMKQVVQHTGIKPSFSYIHGSYTPQSPGLFDCSFWFSPTNRAHGTSPWGYCCVSFSRPKKKHIKLAKFRCGGFLHCSVIFSESPQVKQSPAPILIERRR